MTPTAERHFGAGGGIEPHGFYAVFLNCIFLSLTCNSYTKPTAPVINIATILTSFLTYEIIVKISAVKLVSADKSIKSSTSYSQMSMQIYDFLRK